MTDKLSKKDFFYLRELYCASGYEDELHKFIKSHPHKEEINNLFKKWDETLQSKLKKQEKEELDKYIDNLRATFSSNFYVDKSVLQYIRRLENYCLGKLLHKKSFGFKKITKNERQKLDKKLMFANLNNSGKKKKPLEYFQSIVDQFEKHTKAGEKQIVAEALSGININTYKWAKRKLKKGSK